MEQERRARAVEGAGLDDEARTQRPDAQVEELLPLLARLRVAGSARRCEFVAARSRCGCEPGVDLRRGSLELALVLAQPRLVEPEVAQRLDGGLLAPSADAQGRVAPAVAGDARQPGRLAGEGHRAASRSSAS